MILRRTMEVPRVSMEIRTWAMLQWRQTACIQALSLAPHHLISRLQRWASTCHFRTILVLGTGKVELPQVQVVEALVQYPII